MKILIISTVELSKNGIANSIMSYYRAILKQRNYEIDFLYTGFIDESLKDEILNNEGQIFCFGNRKRRPLHYISLLRNLAINKKYLITRFGKVQDQSSAFKDNIFMSHFAFNLFSRHSIVLQSSASVDCENVEMT